jgi:hypothetical protein
MHPVFVSYVPALNNAVFVGARYILPVMTNYHIPCETMHYIMIKKEDNNLLPSLNIMLKPAA